MKVDRTSRLSRLYKISTTLHDKELDSIKCDATLTLVRCSVGTVAAPRVIIDNSRVARIRGASIHVNESAVGEVFVQHTATFLDSSVESVVFKKSNSVANVSKCYLGRVECGRHRNVSVHIIGDGSVIRSKSAHVQDIFSPIENWAGATASALNFAGIIPRKETTSAVSMATSDAGTGPPLVPPGTEPPAGDSVEAKLLHEQENDSGSSAKPSAESAPQLSAEIAAELEVCRKIVPKLASTARDQADQLGNLESLMEEINNNL